MPGWRGSWGAALDGTRCYAPASGTTALVGYDVTGSLPGYYWNLDSERRVVGWDPNLAYGPIPTMRLSYTRPRTTITETDRWDDQCPAVADGSRDCAFVYLNLRMGRGRSAAVHQRAGEALAAAARAHFAPLLAERPLGLTLQIDEGAEVFDAKHGNLHALFSSQG